MADNLTKELRHKNMSHIRSKDTKPEEKVRKYLFSKGFRYRKNVKNLPGCPDIVLRKYHTVILVNGCFWHKHDCDKFVWPKSNEEYWKKKISKNAERDINIINQLEKAGWRVQIVWECQLNSNFFDRTMNNLMSEILLTYEDNQSQSNTVK